MTHIPVPTLFYRVKNFSVKLIVLLQQRANNNYLNLKDNAYFDNQLISYYWEVGVNLIISNLK